MISDFYDNSQLSDTLSGKSELTGLSDKKDMCFCLIILESLKIWKVWTERNAPIVIIADTIVCWRHISVNRLSYGSETSYNARIYITDCNVGISVLSTKKKMLKYRVSELKGYHDISLYFCMKTHRTVKDNFEDVKRWGFSLMDKKHLVLWSNVKL